MFERMESTFPALSRQNGIADTGDIMPLPTLKGEARFHVVPADRWLWLLEPDMESSKPVVAFILGDRKSVV